MYLSLRAGLEEISPVGGLFSYMPTVSVAVVWCGVVV